MKPHPRIRKTIKWGGLALCLLLAGVWVRSECVWDLYEGGSLNVGYHKGSLWICRARPDAPPMGYEHGTVRSEGWRVWWCSFGLRAGPWGPVIPLWIPLAPTLLATAAAWRLDALARRRARVGFCPKCHYDRTGLAASAVCPECGARPA